MAFTTDSLAKIVAAGGGIVMDCKGFTTASLVKIAAASKLNGVKIILTNLNGSTVDSLVKIGAAGHGNVIFDVRNT